MSISQRLVLSQQSHTRGDALVPFFLFTFAITWGVGAFAIFLPVQFRSLFGELSDTNSLYYIAVGAPTISATLVTLALNGWFGLGILYGRLIQWRFGIQWYALVLIGIPVVGYLVSQVAGSAPKFEVRAPALLFSALLNLLITGPLGEELGWRGYALPRLLNRFNPLFASLILGAIWGVWHLPSFFLSSLVQSTLTLPIFILGAMCLSVLSTWVFLHTGGSVLITVLLHYMFNIALSVLGAPFSVLTLVSLAGAVLVVVLDKEMLGNARI